MDIVIHDTFKFFNKLLNSFNIQMFENKRTSNSISYIGEGYSLKGEQFLISVIIKLEATEIKIYKIGSTRTCIYQKNYSTKSDKQSLSKSVSVYNFLDKLLYR